MRKTFQKRLCFFLVMLCTAASALILPYLSKFEPQRLNKLQVKSGTAEVSSNHLDDGKIVYLTGEWEFFWNERLVSDPHTTVGTVYPGTSVPQYIAVPSSWTGYTRPNGTQPDNGGVASYRMVLKNLTATSPIVICVPNMPGAYAVYINRNLVYATGQLIPYSTEDSSMDFYIEPFVPDASGPADYEVVIETECSLTSGITTLPMLSNYQKYQSRTFGMVALRYFLVGIILFFGVMALFFSRLLGKESNQFWLVLLCAAYALRIVMCNEGYAVSHGWFGNLNYEVMTLAVYVSSYIIKLAMFMHISRVLSLKVSQNTVVLFSAVFLICAFVPYFLSDLVYISETYLWLQSAAYLMDAYLIYKITDAVFEKKRYAISYLAAYCVTAVGMVTDNLYICGHIAANVSMVLPLSCVFFVTVTLIIHSIKTAQAYRDARKTAVLSKELADLNMQLMLSQIQPHFLYNALNTIKYLTKKDPKSAEDAIVRFSGYLRANMDSLTQKEPVAFEKELQHVQNYISIEQLRFGERLKVEYDITVTAFRLPPLTIQPIVENAIKHGINQRAEGGTVTISTDEDKDNWYVRVRDNGVGFTPGEKKQDGRSHVGIDNVSVRLKEMVNAEITIDTVLKEGTCVTVRLPKNAPAQK